MNDDNQYLNPAPSGMNESDFVATFGSVYEHSPWVARNAWQQGITAEHDCVAGLASTLAAQVENAGEAAQLELIRLHPDLGGKAATAGEVTSDSAREQSGAGLNNCTPAQYERLQQLNADYTDKFGFPFVVAVKGLNREDILAAMAERLGNDTTTEQRRALDEIHKIARLRLAAMA